MGGKQQEMDSRDEGALKRAAIVEKWWQDKIQKATIQSENLRKEGVLEEVEERKIEELQKMRKQE